VSAATWQDVGALSLRRRDREAMVLALSCLRGRTVLDRDSDTDEWLEQYGDMRVSDALCALKCASPWGVAGQLVETVKWARKRAPRRLIRARLALLLRVLLRVDAGDEGPVEFKWRCFRDDRGPALEAAGWGPTLSGWRKRLPVRPLWEQVPR